MSELGNRSDLLREEQIQDLLLPFEGYPSIVRRIIIDKPDGWEYQLSAELLRFLTKLHFRKIKDLKNKLYLKTQNYITEDDAAEWIDLKRIEMSNLFEPATKTLNNLTNSWGKEGEEGDVNEIHHACKLLSDHVQQVLFLKSLLNSPSHRIVL